MNGIAAIHRDVGHVRPGDPAVAVRDRAGLPGGLSEHRDAVGGALDGSGGKREGPFATMLRSCGRCSEAQARAGQARDGAATV